MTGDLFEEEPLEAAAEGKDEKPESALVLRVHVQPGPGQASVVGRNGDALAVRVARPPRDPAANAAVCTLLQHELVLEEAQITLVAGETAPGKRFRVVGLSPEELRHRLEEALGQRSRPGARGARGGR